jgi:hypothetical protein
MKRHKKGTVCSGQERKKAAAQRKAKQAAKDGGGSGDIGDIGGGNTVEGRRSNTDTLDKASGLHQNRIVVARWQQSRKQQQQLATRPEAGERVVGSTVTSAAAVIRIAIRCSSDKQRQWIG